jgi:hypothetical protein
MSELPQEAIEAAAEALEKRSENDDWEWCLGDACAALTAAAPYLAAQTLRDAAEALDLQPPKLRAQYVATLRLYADEPWRLRARADRIEAS